MSKLIYGLLATTIVSIHTDVSLASDSEHGYDDNMRSFHACLFEQTLPLQNLNIREDSVSLLPENNRQKESLMLLKMRGDQCAAATGGVGADTWQSLIQNMQVLKSGGRLTLEAGLPDKFGKWIYAPTNFTIKAPGVSLGSQFVESGGSLNFVITEFECRTLFHPLATLTLESACNESPIRKIMLTLANNQLPMTVAGRVRFAAQPIIDLEMLNVGKLDLEINPALFDVNIPAQVPAANIVAPKAVTTKGPAKAPAKAAAKAPAKAPSASKLAPKAAKKVGGKAKK